MITASLYIRVSTDEQAEKGYSQRNQEEVLRKYCEIKHIQVDKVYLEDHSAKTFKRPTWNRLLVDLRKRKGKTDLVLFTKWDRFSRNAGDAYHMLGILKKWGVEPQAIEQPLDLTIPENKMMLAFYLAAPEVENDRRGLNIFYGLRRARKEGRWVNGAPYGYQNLCDEHGKKYIAQVEPAASIMKWVFQEMSKGTYNQAQVFQLAVKKGLKCKLNNFYDLIRNPVYCGLIVVPKHKDEEEHLVQGQHKPVVSEALFYKVQQILNPDKIKKYSNKVNEPEHYYLRGFLQCPRCTRLLTASGSKGRKEYYHYYHCFAKCGTRFKSAVVNTEFEKEIQQYFIQPRMLTWMTKAIMQALKDNSSGETNERKQVLNDIHALNKKISDCRELLITGAFDAGDFRSVKMECEKQINALESRLPEIAKNMVDVRSMVSRAISNLQVTDNQFKNFEMKKKRDYIGSIYPENVCFDGQQHRTARVNELCAAISLISKKLKAQKKREDLDFSSLPASVVWAGIEPATHGFSVHCSTD
jgi:site-specific DNA recombinase